MPVGMLMEMPGMTAEIYDAVNAKMDTTGNPPEGLLFHSAGPAENGNWRIFDAWESQDAFDRFSESRLQAALAEVMQGQGAGGPPQQEFYELHGMLQP